ncbi:metallophosphoesterase [Candidatus Dependentiae bacterium]|nr:metallophosphoesterase [Candidatus Dependentiae bacterium]
MKILYVTDLHGDTNKYNRLFEVARERRVDLVINGGDMLSKSHGELFNQGDFIEDFLNKHFSLFDSNDIGYLCCLGNDDLRVFDDLFEKTCDKHPFVSNLSQSGACFLGYEFIGLNLIVDSPFGLKDRCRMDTSEYKFQKQYRSALLSTPDGWEELNDWEEYAHTLRTIEEELSTLVRPNDMSKTIYVIHMPPHKIGLDECYSGLKVGSKAVYEFLEKNQPFMSLHGHIHESPEVSEKWHAKIGKTICIQPGQREDFTYVIIDLDNKSIVRMSEKIDTPYF